MKFVPGQFRFEYEQVHGQLEEECWEEQMEASQLGEQAEAQMAEQGAFQASQGTWAKHFIRFQKRGFLNTSV